MLLSVTVGYCRLLSVTVGYCRLLSVTVSVMAAPLRVIGVCVRDAVVSSDELAMLSQFNSISLFQTYLYVMHINIKHTVE